MSETLRQRVTRVISGGAHALLDKIEDAAPVAMLEQSVREVDAIAEEVRAELGRMVANRHLAQQQHIHLNTEHEQLSSSIDQTLQMGREDLARPAIARQIDIEAQLPVLETSLSELASHEKELSGFVDALIGKKREMEQAIRDFEKSRESFAGACSALQPGRNLDLKLADAQSVFDRTFQRQTGLDASSRSGSLGQAAKLKELGDLMRENKINERLAALKTSQGST